MCKTGVIGNPMSELARRLNVDLHHIPADTIIYDADGVCVCVCVCVGVCVCGCVCYVLIVDMCTCS